MVSVIGIILSTRVNRSSFISASSISASSRAAKEEKKSEKRKGLSDYGFNPSETEY